MNFRAVLEDSPNGPLFFWYHVCCDDSDQYVASGFCLQEREIPVETQVSIRLQETFNNSFSNILVILHAYKLTFLKLVRYHLALIL